MSGQPLPSVLSIAGRQVRSQPRVFAYVLAASLLALVPGIGVPLLVRVFLDEYLVSANAAWARPVMVGLLLAALVVAALTGLQWRTMGRLATRLSAERPTGFVWHALRLPVSTVDGLGAGDVTARGSALQREAFQAGFLVPLAATRVVAIVAYSCALLWLDWRLGLAALAVVALSITASLIALRQRARSQAAADRSRVAQSAYTSRIVGSYETVKAAAAEQWVFERWMRQRTELGDNVAALGTAGQRMGAISPLTQVAGLGIVLAVGALLVLRGDLSLGTFVASQGLLLELITPASLVIWLGALLQGVASTQAQAAVVQDLQLDPEVLPVDDPAPTLPDGPIGVGLADIRFGYEPGGPPLFDGLNLEVRPGSVVALVGGSGSGKTTLVKLVTGELQPWSGTVRLAGVPRLRLARGDRSRAIAYVPQSTVLVPGTILENLTLFDGSIPQSRVVAAARAACIDHVIEARPYGYLEPVSQTSHGFSGGELQRLAIARALVRDPQVLVLDEATSALDPVLEEQIEQNLRRRACTTLVVAHRLSAVRDADVIVVLDGGRIVQQGDFDELRQGGAFRELVHG